MPDSPPPSSAVPNPPTPGRVQSPGKYLVVDDGGRVMGDFDVHEDAVNMMRGWNHAYPTPPYPPFFLDPPMCDDPECECHV